MKFILAVVAVLIAATARADNAYVIDGDEGGFISSYESHYVALKLSRIPVQIAGDCISACTLVLSLPKDQVCAWPEARLGFHYATGSDDKIDPQATREVAERYYPVEVAVWFLAQQPNKDNDPIFRDASDFFAKCPGDEPEYLKRKKLNDPIVGVPE